MIKADRRITKITDANGQDGCLLYIHVTGQYVFRVYRGDVGGKEFTDYDLMHSDLCVTINDPDSAFYTYEDGTQTLDHTPETLGIKHV